LTEDEAAGDMLTEPSLLYKTNICKHKTTNICKHMTTIVELDKSALCLFCNYF